MTQEAQSNEDKLRKALEHARDIARLFSSVDISEWKPKGDLQVCFREDLVKYEEALK